MEKKERNKEEAKKKKAFHLGDSREVLRRILFGN